MKSRIAYLSLALLCMAPFLYRLLDRGVSEGIGLLSDAGVGLLLWVVLFASPRWLRVVLAWVWALFSLGAQELAAAMHRLPTWQDFKYLADPSFVGNSTGGLNLAAPGLAITLIAAAVLVTLLPLERPRHRHLGAGLVTGLVLLLVQSQLSIAHDDQRVIARHNALQWFITDALLAPPRLSPEELGSYVLPKTLASLDLQGQSLLKDTRARNLLIVTLEGIPGLYYPEIRQAMGVADPGTTMSRLAAATPGAMLVPDFVTHSHQTIRGLYALLCGDFSKLSWDTPKAVELLSNPARAAECLPAQMRRQGWQTHYLQGAGLAFMGKDRVMPSIGFESVHGVEWFKEANPYPFTWGATDAVFFRGARDYIAGLRQQKEPWMLTLLTVGTHQPYAVPDEIAARYPSRLAATVDLLDEAVGGFIEGLREDGVLDDTLVIVTSDESHGSNLGDWMSSWGLGVVLAPQPLPRIKSGSYGMVDIEASLLDYFKLDPPGSLIGRSLFRDYTTPRDMLSFTTSKRRWHTADGLRFECLDDGRCRVGKAASLLGEPPVEFDRDKAGKGDQIFAISQVLDAKLASGNGLRDINFARGEIRQLPEQFGNDWSDNLVGAQYLDFPAHSRVKVSVRVKVLQAPDEGVHLRLGFKQWESDQKDISHPGFPVLHQDQEGRLEFSFDNTLPRQAFSFHLLGEGKGGVVRLDEFRVHVVDQDTELTSR